jgi:hypothetical protein
MRFAEATVMTRMSTARLVSAAMNVPVNSLPAGY